MDRFGYLIMFTVADERRSDAIDVYIYFVKLESFWIWFHFISKICCCGLFGIFHGVREAGEGDGLCVYAFIIGYIICNRYFDIWCFCSNGICCYLLAIGQSSNAVQYDKSPWNWADN